MRTAGLILSIALAGVVLLSLLLPGPPAEPKQAPEFSLRSLEGELVSLSDFRGQVVVLDFWATWCTPCLTSFPALHALLEPYVEQGVVLIVVSLDRNEETAREYLIENGYTTDRVLWGSLAEARAVQDLYGVVGIPRTIVIDREGLIRFAGHPDRLDGEVLSAWL
jgi:cytochrome c biogenesis protein CcmG, thiol:disulfide interchange protein DsbE